MTLWYSYAMPKAKLKHDEVDAMRDVTAALEPLGSDEQGRVLRWAAERFSVALSQSGGGRSARREDPARRGSAAEEPEDAGEFYSQTDPEKEPERALVMAYWVQEVRGDGEFDAHTVNTQLKHLGHGVSNITRALDDLKARKPQLVIQVQKSGKSQQARKRYKVTSAGKAEVQRMLTAQSDA
jgi:hypothetical protein